MSDDHTERTGHDLVPIAEFSYRHQAELAAGFLDDAGIPFRLQVDDAGGAEAGVTIGRPAVLWVRGEDAAEACELLELEHPESRTDSGTGSVRPRLSLIRGGLHEGAGRRGADGEGDHEGRSRPRGARGLRSWLASIFRGEEER